ncbi:tRNA (adenosine(37)-N6)-dimethylallyltransferase MiaA [Candidatus Daviesbacteria bacterium]|nr:tRNA (adenosine(37)-N6)-dimethylallyltransferase MiaA [Candidatus Daviesbacteria bacterium]
MENTKILAILGPTSTGKTDLALQLARKFQGELISCDSRQVYKGLDIGTGKAPDKFKIENLKLKIKKENGQWIINGINIWMYDVVDPKKQYTVVDYVKDAGRVIEDVRSRGKLPIVVGGTGLYLKALLEGLPNLIVPTDKNLRKNLEKLSLEQLQDKLKELSPERWQDLNQSDRQNPRRLSRHIELLSMYPYMNTKEKYVGIAQRFNILKIGLSAPRHILYKRAEKKVLARIKQGIVAEAKKVHRKGLSLTRMRELGLEYGALADYLEGNIKDINELIKIMQGKIHGLMRRQLTWFKKELNVRWFDISKKEFPANVEKLAVKWYDRAHGTKN